MKRTVAGKLMFAQAAAVAAVIIGCRTDDAPPADPVFPVQTRICVAAALTRVDPGAYGGWDGECPGADVDLANVKIHFPLMGSAVAATLFNKDATDFRFLGACLSAAKALGITGGGVLDIYYSGHGGQVRDTDGDEEDGLDETLCLWNGQCSDDLIGDFLSKVPSSVQVNFWTDCCNSGSNYRAPGISLQRVFKSRAGKNLKPIVCKVAHLGGCSDGGVSLGGYAGGEFSNALWKTYRKGMSWGTLRTEMAKLMPAGQTPVFESLNMTGEEAVY